MPCEYEGCKGCKPTKSCKRRNCEAACLVARAESRANRTKQVRRFKAAEPDAVENHVHVTTPKQARIALIDRATVSLRTHRVHGYEIQVTAEEIAKLFANTTHCKYCGRELCYDRSERLHAAAASLDRTDNSNVIRADNVQVICHECNASKGARTHAQLVEYAKLVLARNPE